MPDFMLHCKFSCKENFLSLTKTAAQNIENIQWSLICNPIIHEVGQPKGQQVASIDRHESYEVGVSSRRQRESGELNLLRSSPHMSQ
jgi:hypothetical protein